MKIFRFFLVLCLPAFLLNPIPLTAFPANPINSSGQETQEAVFNVPRDELGRVNPWVLLKPENLSIDRYFAFIDLTENESFLMSLSEEEFDIVVDFVTQMIQASAPESLEGLKECYEAEINQLMEDLYAEPEWTFPHSEDFDFEIAPASSVQRPKIILCKKKKDKGWFARKAHHFAHWCDKHKEPLIAGGVVVGVFAVSAFTGGVGTSSAIAVGGALIGGSLDKESPQRINKPGEVFVDHGQHYPPPSSTSSAADSPIHQSNSNTSEPTPLEQAHALTFDKAEEAKLEIAEAFHDKAHVSEETVLEKAKDVTKVVVSNIVHEVFESVSKVGARVHEIYPSSTPEGIQAYKEHVAAQHAKIDEIFGTYCPDYNLESKEYSEAFKAAIMEELGHRPEMQVGELPPPTVLISAASRAAVVASRALGIAAKSTAAVGSAAVVGSMINWEAPIPMTQANDKIGWKVGDPINNRTINGNVPTWSAVHYRHWRNEALNIKNGVVTRALEKDVYKPTVANIKRMEKGLAPQTEDPETGKMVSIELHHIPPQREGGLFDFIEVTPWEHAEMDPHRHTGGH